MRKPGHHTGSMLALVFVTILVFPALVLAGQYNVTRVIDGDTIVVQKGATKLTIRLVGIDAPETSKKKHEPGQLSQALSLELFK